MTPLIFDKAVQEAKEAGTQIEEADTAQVRAELFMYGEEFPPDYWKELAEKRREALDTSLAENEELHTSLSQLEEEKESLRKVGRGLVILLKWHCQRDIHQSPYI